MSRESAETLWGGAVVETMLSRRALPPSPALLNQIREAATGGPAWFARWALGLPVDTFACIVHVVAGDALNDLMIPLRRVG